MEMTKKLVEAQHKIKGVLNDLSVPESLWLLSWITPQIAMQSVVSVPLRGEEKPHFVIYNMPPKNWESTSVKVGQEFQITGNLFPEDDTPQEI